MTIEHLDAFGRSVIVTRNLRIVTAPVYEPVTLAQAKAFCRVDDDITDQDAVIRILIQAARERAEALTGRAFIQRDAELLMDGLPASEFIELPLAPLQYVSYVRYRDSSGAEQELAGSPDAWLQDTKSTPGRVSPLYGASWPGTNCTVSNVRIGFRCGYAPVGSPDNEAAYQAGVPALLKMWMQVRVSTFYEQRESLVVGGILTQTPRDYVDGLLDGLVVNRGFA